MAPKLSKRLSKQEFASLLAVGNTAVNGPPAAIPAEHSARLTGVCTENLSSGVVVVKSAKDGV